MTGIVLESVMPFTTVVPVENGKKLIGLSSIRRECEADAFDVPCAPETADAWFDRRWAWSQIKRAMERIKSHFHERGRSELFAALKPGLANPELLKPYAVCSEARHLGKVKPVRATAHGGR